MSWDEITDILFYHNPTLPPLTLLYRHLFYYLSGALSWDEITDILFEADTDDEEPELEAVIELRQALQEMLASQEVPITGNTPTL